MSTPNPQVSNESRAVEHTGTCCRIDVDLRALGIDSLHRWRLLLMADVLRRFLEVIGERRVLVAILDADVTGAAPAVSGPLLAAPIWRVNCPDEAAAALGGPPTLVLEPGRPRYLDDPRSGPRILRVGVVVFPGRPNVGLHQVLDGQDPATLRLALLRSPCQAIAVLSTARLHRAEETVQRWRAKVSMWHDLPPAPPVATVVDAARAALAADLDTPAVLHQLHRLEIDQQVTSGGKFETFTRLDRVLGLDLGHLIGKLHR